MLPNHKVKKPNQSNRKTKLEFKKERKNTKYNFQLGLKPSVTPDYAPISDEEKKDVVPKEEKKEIVEDTHPRKVTNEKRRLVKRSSSVITLLPYDRSNITFEEYSKKLEGNFFYLDEGVTLNAFHKYDEFLMKELKPGKYVVTIGISRHIITPAKMLKKIGGIKVFYADVESLRQTVHNLKPDLKIPPLSEEHDSIAREAFDKVLARVRTADDVRQVIGMQGGFNGIYPFTTYEKKLFNNIVSAYDKNELDEESRSNWEAVVKLGLPKKSRIGVKYSPSGPILRHNETLTLIIRELYKGSKSVTGNFNHPAVRKLVEGGLALEDSEGYDYENKILPLVDEKVLGQVYTSWNLVKNRVNTP